MIMITVGELIKTLQKYDNNLPVAIATFECTNLINEVRLETINDHCYDKGDHILEAADLDECVMLADDQS